MIGIVIFLSTATTTLVVVVVVVVTVYLVFVYTNQPSLPNLFWNPTQIIIIIIILGLPIKSYLEVSNNNKHNSPKHNTTNPSLPLLLPLLRHQIT